MTHPAQHHVNASRKRQKSWVEGRARGGKVDRPGKKFGGAAERKDSQSTADEYPGPENAHIGPGPYGSKVRAHGGKLTAGERNEMPSKEFALPGHGKGPEGKGSGSYPIPDERHARAALSRASANASPSERAEIKRKVHAKFPDIKES